MPEQNSEKAGPSLTKQAVIFVSVAVLTAVLVIAGIVVWLMLGFAEPKNMKQGSLRAWLFVPEAVSKIPMSGLCSEPDYSKALEECGGICGETFYINYNSKSSKSAIERETKAYHSKALAQYELRNVVDEQTQASECRPVLIDLYKRF